MITNDIKYKVRLSAISAMAIIFLFLTTALPVTAQKLKTENLLIVTTDGLRWKEVFNGAEWDLLTDKRYNSTDSLTLGKMFWDSATEERRKKTNALFLEYDCHAWAAIWK